MFGSVGVPKDSRAAPVEFGKPAYFGRSERMLLSGWSNRSPHLLAVPRVVYVVLPIGPVFLISACLLLADAVEQVYGIEPVIISSVLVRKEQRSVRIQSPRNQFQVLLS